MGKYLTVRQIARLPDCPIKEYSLRRLVKDGRIRGFYVGTRFFTSLSDVQEALDRLKAESK